MFSVWYLSPEDSPAIGVVPLGTASTILHAEEVAARHTPEQLALRHGFVGSVVVTDAAGRRIQQGRAVPCPA